MRTRVFPQGHVTRDLPSTSERVVTRQQDAAPAPFAVPRAVVSVSAPTTHDLHRRAMLLAVEADCDVRSARRAIEEGPDAIRGRAGERIRLAASTLGITLGQSSTDNEPNSVA